jgi:hypothetical protein
MAQRTTLNEFQIAVLRWIADGCPNGDLDESVSARISAAALRNRGLARTSGQGLTWKAAVTSAGLEYLQRVDGPDPPQRRQPNVSVTQQLVNDVVSAGGSLRLPRKRLNDRQGVDYERRARLAERHGKVPAGSRLVVKALSPDEVVIELAGNDRSPTADGGEWPGGLAPIVVPSRLSKYHRMAREFRECTTLHEVSRKLLPRVLRIVHALASEAERRGYEVTCVRVRDDGYGRTEWRPAQDGQFVFTIVGHQLRVRIWEKGCGLRGPYEHQLERWRRDREQPVRLMQFVDRPKPYDSGAIGELNIEVLGGASGRQKSWGDRSRWILEDRLAHLLRELELQAVEAEERRLAREHEEAERQRQWEAAVYDAKRRVIEDHRLEVMRARVREWEEAEAIRAYCDAIEARHGAEAIAAEPDAVRWLALAREHADRAQELPRMPGEPEITHERLQRYLKGWSPYGPHQR